MGFASTYLDERVLFPEMIKEAPDNQTGIIVVIPAFDEPGIAMLLDSLVLCSEPDCKVEVIIVVNAPPHASGECIKNNLLTLINIESWKKKNNNYFFRLYAFTPEPIIGGWGVGLARKTGMDEAVRRFNAVSNPDGIILSLDADCTVEQNYFTAVYKEFLNRKDRSACSIYFEHPLSGNNYQVEIYKYITLYELHLRYYFQGLIYAGVPFVSHTVGSALAVRAQSYVKAGGMNRKKAGEDFYFIQKLIPAGGFFNLNSTTVYPSPRASSRVPFGTGASIGKLTEKGSTILMTYNTLAFKELHSFFSLVKNLYSCSASDIHGIYDTLPEGLRLFMDKNEFILKVSEIKNNTSGFYTFEKRFFSWFNMFRIVKYLNKIHSGIFEKKPVEVSALELLADIGITFKTNNPTDLLHFYRSLEKNT